MKLETLKHFIAYYGIQDGSDFISKLLTMIVSYVVGYNHNKYWKRRAYLIDDTKKNIILKFYYFLYVKRVDARKLSSFGSSYNSGCQFITPPILPHGPNGIIVAHDAKIGRDVTIFQQVTIAQGGVVIGDGVILGAGCKILSGVHIGNKAKIGANAVVIEDVPDGATCVLQRPKIIIK